MSVFQNKKIYLKTTTSFNKSDTLGEKKKLIFHFHKHLQSSEENHLPLLGSFKKDNMNTDKLIHKMRFKKTKFVKSQEKLNRLIKEEENFRKYYINLIQNKVKDRFTSYLLNTNDLSEDETIKNTFMNPKKIEDEKTQRKIEREEKKVFSDKNNLGKDEINCNDYLKRFTLLFPGEFLTDEIMFQKQSKYATIIQRYFREHKNKIKIFIGFEEPDYLIRIYEHEHDAYGMIKSVEIKIYSLLFKKNVSVIKTIEELFGVANMSRDKIVRRTDEIIFKMIGLKNKKIQNRDYYDIEKADLSSDDFNDFEED